MKIKVCNESWGDNFLYIQWPFPYAPRDGEAIEVTDFVSDDDYRKLKGSKASEWGYADDAYDNALEAIEDDFTSRVNFSRWMRNRKTGQVTLMVMLE